MACRILWLMLKLMLLALTTATEDDVPSCKAWASDDGMWLDGGSGLVTCACDDGKVPPTGLSFQLRGKTLDPKIVNNSVIHEVEKARKAVQYEYECWWNGEPVKSVMVTVLPVLNVTDLSCRFEVMDKLNCSFSRADSEAFHEMIRYQLGVGSGSTDQCTADPSNASKMHCMLEVTSYASKMPNQIFNLTMSSNRSGVCKTQTQQIELFTESMYVLEWPSSKPIPTTVGDNRTCLAWDNAQDLLETDLEWAVEWRPRLPGVPPLNLTLPGGEKVDQRILTFCFDHPPQGYQVFDVRLRCRIVGNKTMWSEYYPEFQITTNATVPARPPQFMPNGFSYDQDDRELTVFWFPLDQIDHNGPNLTYDVYWKGQKASRTYSTSATFENWDTSQSANVTVRSRNSKGVSLDISWLWVPAIEDVAKRQATHLRYQHENGSTTLNWNKPEDNDQLAGYTIYWCNASDTLGQFCLDRVPIHNITLDDGELQEYKFNSSMALQDIALEPKYNNSVSGGMSVRLVAVEKKEFESFTLRKARILEGISALVVLGLMVMAAKKLHKMNSIRVEMPEMGALVTAPEPQYDPEPSPRLGVPRITNPYYDHKTILSFELQTFTGKEQDGEQEKEQAEAEPEESFTEVVTLTEPESSSYVRMDAGNGDIRPPPQPRINLNHNGYVMASPPQVIPNNNNNNNGYVMAPPPPRLIPNNEGYINPPPPRLNPNNNNGYVMAPPPRLDLNINGYVMAPPPRSIPTNNGYVDPPPPRLIPNVDGYINPPPPPQS